MKKNKSKKEPSVIKLNIWILTTELNLHDQDGEYYVKSFDHIPSKEEVFKYVKIPFGLGVTDDEFHDNLINQRYGRYGTENRWYHLRQETEVEL